MPEEKKSSDQKAHWRELAELLGLDPGSEPEPRNEEPPEKVAEEDLASPAPFRAEAASLPEAAEEEPSEEFLPEEEEVPSPRAEFPPELHEPEPAPFVAEEDVRIEELERGEPPAAPETGEEEQPHQDPHRRRGRRSSRKRGRYRKDRPADGEPEPTPAGPDDDREVPPSVEAGREPVAREKDKEVVIEGVHTTEELPSAEGIPPSKEEEDKEEGRQRRRRSRRRGRRKRQDGSETLAQPPSRVETNALPAETDANEGEWAPDEERDFPEEPAGDEESSTDYDIMDDEEAEDFSDWTVPSWNELIASLYRPDR